jgi:PAS domain S-box-containing protein
MLRDHLPALLQYLWHTHLALIVISDTLDIVDANDASSALSGYHHHHMVGKPLARFLEVDHSTEQELEHTRQNFHRKTNTHTYRWSLLRVDQRPLDIFFSKQWIVKHAGTLFHVVVVTPITEREDVQSQLEAATDAFFDERQHARAKQHTSLALEALASDNLETIIAVHQTQTKFTPQATATPKMTTSTSRVSLSVSNDISRYDDITVTLNERSSHQPLYYKHATRAYVLNLKTTPYDSTYQPDADNDGETQANEQVSSSDDTLRQLVWDFR